MKDTMLLGDYLSSFDVSDFSKYILSYIKAKESAQFKDDINRIEHKQNILIHCFDKFSYSHVYDIMDIDQDTLDNRFDNEYSFRNYGNNDLIETNTDLSRVLWENVMKVLAYCRENNRVSHLFANYNRILKLHIDHNIFLDVQCFSCLLHCTRPEYIETLFNKGLIREQDLSHLSCLFRRQLLLLGLNIFEETKEFESLNLWMNSLTVLLYKIKCQRIASDILSNLEMKLAVFINKEKTQQKNNSYWQMFKNRTVNQFLKAIYLNGIFQKESMNRLLDSRVIRNEIEMSDSDSDWPDWPDVDEDVLIDANNNQVRRNRQMSKFTVGERIKSISNTREINNMFPMSLKNLARIQIKESMIIYTAKNVLRMSILPRDLKQFVLFQNEIDSVKQ